MAEQVRAPTPLAVRAVAQTLWPHRDHVRAWLDTDGLRLTTGHRRRLAQGVRASSRARYRVARVHGEVGAPSMTVRVADPPPGEAAEADCGLLGLWTDPESGPWRRIDGLLVTLCFSRDTFLASCLRQDLPAGLDGLEAAWAFFAAVVRRLVSDPLTPAVTRADRSAPRIQKVFLEDAQSRGFVVDPAGPRHATRKPKVARTGPSAREDFFRGETFRDLAELHTRATAWCRDLAGTRVHGPTRQVPRVVFETTEPAAVLPLAPAPFDRPPWARGTVHPDPPSHFRCALSSVPTRSGGQRVDVRGDRRLVRISRGAELRNVHAPHAPGGRAEVLSLAPRGGSPWWRSPLI